MTTYALARIVRGTFSWTLPSGAIGQNVIHFGMPATPVQGDLDTIAVEAENFINIGATGHKVKDYLANQTVLNGATFRTIDPSNPLESVGVYNTTCDGSGVAVPSESAVVTTLYTAVASRRGRGRMYTPGFTSSFMDSGHLASGIAAYWETAWDAWKTHMLSDADADWVVWSPTSASGHSVTAFATRNILHHQKRRNA